MDRLQCYSKTLGMAEELFYPKIPTLTMVLVPLSVVQGYHLAMLNWSWVWLYLQGLVCCLQHATNRLITTCNHISIPGGH